MAERHYLYGEDVHAVIDEAIRVNEEAGISQ